MTSSAQSGAPARTFIYDDLARVTQEVNPESGTTTYAYDTQNAGDLYTRTRPAQNGASGTVVTTYTHDGLHRLTNVSYADGGVTPATGFSYDESNVSGTSITNGKGRLTHSSTIGTAATILSYDVMGRVLKDYQCTPLNCGTGSFGLLPTYDNLGDMLSLTDPDTYSNTSGPRTYTYTYNAAAQLTTVQSNFNDSNHPPTLLSNVTYNPLGEMEQATLGNNIVRNPSYDNLGRVTSLTDGSIYNYSLGYWSNSNIHTANDSASGNWTYGYDDFNRLATASETGQSFNYDYDQFGNRWGTNSSCTASNHSACQYTFNANNQITDNGFKYDLAGNVINDGFHSYTYDAEGRITQVDAGQTAVYYYDGFGHRVRKIAGGVTRDFLYDLAGHIYQEVDGTVAAKTDLYTPGGLHLGSYADGTTYFSHANWLGTELVRTGPTGSVLWSCTGSLPFGDGENCTGNMGSYVDGISGLWLDLESGLTHTIFRDYSSTQGRWQTPDPAGLAAVDPSNPQTWNRYAYVNNNPLSLIDPTGLDCVYMNDDETVNHLTVGDNCDSPTDNGYFFDGTVDQSTVFVNANGDAMAQVNGAVDFTCSGECPGDSITVNGGPPVDITNSSVTPPTSPCTSANGRPYGAGHPARDYHLPSYGTSIPAPENGIVTAGRSNAAHIPAPYDYSQSAPPGTVNFTQMLTASGYSVKYVHVYPAVPLGTSVLQGSTVGVSDNSGRITGPHTHVQVTNPSGLNIDPNIYFGGVCQ